MKIIDIAREVDNIFFEDNYTLIVTKINNISNVIIKANNTEIQLCKVGDDHSVNLNGEVSKISRNAFEGILMPYLGKRLFISL